MQQHKAKKALVVPTGKAAKGKGPFRSVKADSMRVMSGWHHKQVLPRESSLSTTYWSEST